MQNPVKNRREEPPYGARVAEPAKRVSNVAKQGAHALQITRTGPAFGAEGEMRDEILSAVRQWRKAPGATAIAVLSLTLGIGGTLALFSLVDALLLKTLPVHEPERLARFVGRDLRPGEQHEIGLPTHVWEHVRDHQTLFESVLAVGTGRVNLARGGETRHADIAFVGAGYFDTLGLRPAAGRALHRFDETLNNATAAVISHSLWQREYGGRATSPANPFTSTTTASTSSASPRRASSVWRSAE